MPVWREGSSGGPVVKSPWGNKGEQTRRLLCRGERGKSAKVILGGIF